MPPDGVTVFKILETLSLFQWYAVCYLHKLVQWQIAGSLVLKLQFWLQIKMGKLPNLPVNGNHANYAPTLDFCHLSIFFFFKNL